MGGSGVEQLVQQVEYERRDQGSSQFRCQMSLLGTGRGAYASYKSGMEPFHLVNPTPDIMSVLVLQDGKITL